MAATNINAEQKAVQIGQTEKAKKETKKKTKQLEVKPCGRVARQMARQNKKPVRFASSLVRIANKAGIQLSSRKNRSKRNR